MLKVRVRRPRRCLTNIVPAGEQYGTALQAAAAVEKRSLGDDFKSFTESFHIASKIVALLLANGANPNVQGAGSF
jgi:hypothetical protein